VKSSSTRMGYEVAKKARRATTALTASAAPA
jgi:hypothetical protein